MSDWREYKDWIALYFIVLAAILGAFCIGVLVILA